MRAWSLVLLLALAAPAHAGAAPARAASSGSPAARASFARLATQLPGAEGIAITAGGATVSYGRVSTGVAWSTSKVPVALAAIAKGSARTADLTQAITASDNDAAERLWGGLGAPASAAAAATAQLRAGGDARTVVESRRLAGAAYSAFGQTTWRLRDQAAFALRLGCTAPGARVLGLMRRVIPAQHWGLGSIGRRAAFKGGWGPGARPGQTDGWLDRQLGTFTAGGVTYGVALASTAPDHAQGTRALTRLAAWAAAHTAGLAAAPAC